MKNQLSAKWIFLFFLAALSQGAAQTIVSINPTFGQANSYVTISGYDLRTNSIVMFGNVRASARLTAVVGGMQQMQATVPTGLTAPVLISVQNTWGNPYYSPSYFTNIGAGPFISDFSPGNGNAGTPVTINGANFSGATGVKFGTIPASFTATVLNKITAYVPNGIVTAPITVTTPKGYYTSGAYFYAPPSVTGFTPTNGRVGASIKITGQNFLGAAGVQFGNIPATFTVDNNTQITAVVPEGTTGGLISVNASSTTAFSANKFAVLPVVFGFSPTAGVVGTPVTITGQSLNAGSPKVSFGGASPVAASSASYGQIIVLVPAGALSGPLKVTTDNGSFTTVDNFLVPPIVASFTPASGRPGTLVSISGTNFLGTISVSFHGAAAQFTATNNNLIQAKVPDNASSGQIVVTTPAGSSYISQSFLVPPLITGFTPISGVSGTSVTINGSFPDGVTNVWFNKLPAVITATNSSQVSVIL